jgi:hypothetical protein
LDWRAGPEVVYHFTWLTGSRIGSLKFLHNNSDSALGLGQKEGFLSIFADPIGPSNEGGSFNVAMGSYLN